MIRICVVGGGASGMAAAIFAARLGAEVTVLEHKQILGKKILSTGNGRCNLTNTSMPRDCYRGQTPGFAAKALSLFGAEDTIRFFEELGVMVKARDTYIYPRTDQAETVLNAMAKEIARLGIRVVTEAHVTSVRKTGAKFHITAWCADTKKQQFQADRVILACGGKAASVLGSDGSGYELSKSLGHSLSPVVPALVQLRAKEKFFKQLAGIRTQARVSLNVNSSCVASDTGELQLTAYGISGIVVFQVSRFAAMGLYKGQKVSADINFVPEMEEKEWNAFLGSRASKYPEDTMQEFCAGIFPKKLIPVLLKRAGINIDQRVQEMSPSMWSSFAKMCCKFPVDITGTNPFDQAQVCAGGVRTDEVDASTMESLLVPGLYITGELLDIDGICGGYNLQFGWSTGYIAGTNAAVTTW